jgi:uncharacterized protein YndB with AHSA1/START domain
MDTRNTPRDEFSGSTGQELVITRVFDAPRHRVFKAWTDPEQFKQWWGPKNFTTPYVKGDFRPGGKILSCMRSPDGKDYWSTGVFREIVEPERVVVTDSFADENGNVVPASYYGMTSNFPTEMLITATFEERDGKTYLTLRHTGMPSGPEGEDARAGWNESFDKLADYLAREGGSKGGPQTGFTLNR